MNQKPVRMIHADTELSEGNHPFQLEGNYLIETKVAKDLLPEQQELLRKLANQIERLRDLTND
jgi:hypothetical protein